MRMKTLSLACAALVALGSSHARAASCAAHSGPQVAALVELYTSEGCDSCPPADRWLSSLAAQGFGPDRVVPIALHVDYWDYIGWKDPYGKRQFSGRQKKMAALARSALVYTPQVLLQGRDFRGWGGPSFQEAVARINARPAKVNIDLELSSVTGTALSVRARVQAPAGPLPGEPGLFLAAYENRLFSAVTAGENRGRTLEHDYVVLQWEGPFPLEGRRGVELRRDLRLLPGAVSRNSGIAAFVQDGRDGEVLQALMLPACPG